MNIIKVPQTTRDAIEIVDLLRVACVRLSFMGLGVLELVREEIQHSHQFVDEWRNELLALIDKIREEYEEEKE